MVEFNPDKHYVLRKDRTTFDIPEYKKTTVDEEIEISFGNAAKKSYTIEDGKNTHYDIYYDIKGNKIGGVWRFQQKDSNGQFYTATYIHTADADYADLDGNGTIDQKYTDSLYEKERYQKAYNGFYDEKYNRVKSFIQEYQIPAQGIGTYSVDFLFGLRSYDLLDYWNPSAGLSLEGR